MFTANSSNVFHRIESRATAILQTAPIPGRRIVFGLDWARVSDDFTCIIAVSAFDSRGRL
jgi:hypothetical protein